MKHRYIAKSFRATSLAMIEQANEIVDELAEQGFDLTLRQLYYQFVSKALIPNTERSYKNLGTLVNDGRLAGLIDWSAIEDRTRFLRELPHWANPRAIMKSAAQGYREDKWADQESAIECWIEKDALVGVITRVCQTLDIPYFSCRGYVSQSFMYEAGRRMTDYFENDRAPVILHLGDHDPSGIDMTGDIERRLELFAGPGIRIERLALNMDQITHFQPPPNPAKLTDSRAGKYCAEFGYDSWELDALEPKVIVELIERTVLSWRDDEIWYASKDREDEGRARLYELADMT